jgi:hypothetical protein
MPKMFFMTRFVLKRTIAGIDRPKGIQLHLKNKWKNVDLGIKIHNRMEIM